MIDADAVKKIDTGLGCAKYGGAPRRIIEQYPII